MTDKAYIVANNAQELDILKKFEQNNFFWDEGEKPTEWVPSKTAFATYNFDFPYVIASGDDGNIIWFMVDEITEEEIVYDGRNEEKKYKVTQWFINELIKWRDQRLLDTVNGGFYATFRGQDFRELPCIVSEWHLEDTEPIERNKRLIAIIKWLNGEDVFEVEEPHKFIVRSDVTDEGGEYWYVNMHRDMSTVWYQFANATRFNTREEAQEWSNSHQVVVEIDAEGNEVE